jgi:hypothetical protein
MDANGLDTLIAVLAFYEDWSNRKESTSRPAWSTDGGWVKGNFHRYNANWLLERFTGHKVGLSPYHHDLHANFADVGVGSSRWAAWWKENRDKVKIQPPPQEKAVTAETLSKAPSLRLTPPLALTIRPVREVHVYKGGQPLAIQVKVQNVSEEDVVIERFPYSLDYTSKTGSGGIGGGGQAGSRKEDFITLRPGANISWEQTDAPSVDNVTPAMSVEGLQYKLTYSFAGTQFGLRAWRGVLVSNKVDIKVKTQD